MSCAVGPEIVNDGLILHLDAANTKSYPGTGNVWNDLSSNQRDFTIDASGFTFNSTTKSFDMTDTGGISHTGVITASTSATIVYWIKTADVQSLFLGGHTTAYYLGAYRSGNKEYHSNAGTPIFTMDLIEYPNVYDYAIDNQWHMVEFKNVNISTWTTLTFNKYSSYTFGDGSVTAIMMYDRNLTAEESKKNFNALRGRFNL